MDEDVGSKLHNFVERYSVEHGTEGVQLTAP